MEDVKIQEWIKDNSSGHGYGYGSGYGYGDGYGSGDGSGDGYGDGYGSGDGYGDGYGSGDGSGDGYGDGYGYGDGSGDGYGDGYGSGYGYGDGYGSGDGYGDGYGYGYGSGDGYGYNVKAVNGDTVYMIDDVATIITAIHLALAKGFIVNQDFSLSPCFIVKGDGYFAHGSTAKEAEEALREKIFENMDTEEAIEKFIATFKVGEKYSGRAFFEWHHYLTGSCNMGRESFVKNHGINLDDLFTVDEFIAYTENDYGGDTIIQLKEKMNIRKDKNE